MSRLARVVLAGALLFPTFARADRGEHELPLLLSRDQPRRDQQRLRSGQADERRRVLTRAAYTAEQSDEALVLLSLAAQNLNRYSLTEADALLVVRGLATRVHTKLARDGLLTLLTTPTRSGLGYTHAQRSAAHVLARASHLVDPAPEGPPPKPQDEAAEPITVLHHLLELAEKPAFEPLITEALRAHPPRALLPQLEATSGARLRIARALSDVRLARPLRALLNAKTPPHLQALALDALVDLGDERIATVAAPLQQSPNPLLRLAALRAVVTFAPERAAPQLRTLLAESPSLAIVELASQVPSPSLHEQIAAQLRTSQWTSRFSLLSRLTPAVAIKTLTDLANQPATSQQAIDALIAIDQPAATDALIALGRRPDPIGEAAQWALFDRATDRDPLAARARAGLGSLAPKPPIATLLDGRASTQERGLREHWKHLHEAPLPFSRQKLAVCARALWALSPACVFAFGKAMPRTPSEPLLGVVGELLQIQDPSLALELHRGLALSAWPARTTVLIRALLEATDPGLARGLAQLAHQHPPAEGTASALRRALVLRLGAEPDETTARALDGDLALPAARDLLLRDLDRRTRCGYARDDHGTVVPFVLEAGAALVRGVHSSHVELTFTPCLAL